jgi:hypothetical protein
MKAEQFDRLFDEGADLTRYLQLVKARHPGQEQKRVNVDFPEWMVRSLDRTAERLGVPRQSLIKIWIADRLAATSEEHSARKSRQHAAQRRRKG